MRGGSGGVEQTHKKNAHTFVDRPHRVSEPRGVLVWFPLVILEEEQFSSEKSIDLDTSQGYWKKADLVQGAGGVGLVICYGVDSTTLKIMYEGIGAHYVLDMGDYEGHVLFNGVNGVLRDAHGNEIPCKEVVFDSVIQLQDKFHLPPLPNSGDLELDESYVDMVDAYDMARCDMAQGSVIADEVSVEKLGGNADLPYPAAAAVANEFSLAVAVVGNGVGNGEDAAILSSSSYLPSSSSSSSSSCLFLDPASKSSSHVPPQADSFLTDDLLSLENDQEANSEQPALTNSVSIVERNIDRPQYYCPLCSFGCLDLSSMQAHKVEMHSRGKGLRLNQDSEAAVALALSQCRPVVFQCQRCHNFETDVIAEFEMHQRLGCSSTAETRLLENF